MGTRACALCGARVTSAVWEGSGLRGEIEEAPRGGGSLAVLLELPGLSDGAVPRVVASRGGPWREHKCPKASGSYSAANFKRKRRETR